MGYVYGDSTPFPYDIDFIELLRHAVTCGVTLLDAHQSIVHAGDRMAAAELARQADRARLDRVSEAVRQALSAYVVGPERQVLVAARIMDGARGILDEETTAIESHAASESRRAHQATEQARLSAHRALESFLRRSDVPGTEVALRLYPDADAYAGRTTVTTPFGIDATFDVAIPMGHEWTRARRVMEIASGTEVHVPAEAGWLNKRIETRLVRLDKLYVAEVAASSAGSRVTLLRTPKTGPGYEFEITSGATPRATLHEVDEGGHVTGDRPLVLDDDDAVHVFRLWNGILGSTQDLLSHRGSMSSATFGGISLRDYDSPRQVVERIVEVLAPTVRELEKRSGTPRELVLRRDLGEGRRQESYITKAELQEIYASLPQTSRNVFDPFDQASPAMQRVQLPRRNEPEEISAELELDELD